MGKSKLPKLTIDPELKSLLPSLAAEERQGLRQSLQDEGCREAIIVWGNHGDGTTIVDGHNRYELCVEDEIPFTVRKMNFDDRAAVFEWMWGNQHYRRNWNKEQADLVLGVVYNERKKPVGRPEAGPAKAEEPEPKPAKGKKGKAAAAPPPEEPKKSTAEQVAEEFGVSPGKVRMAGKYAEQLGVIFAAAPELQEAILKKLIKTSKEDVAWLATLQPVEIKQFAKAVSGGMSTMKDVAKSAGLKLPGKGKKVKAHKEEPSTTTKVSFTEMENRIGEVIRLVSKADAILGGPSVHSRGVKDKLDVAFKAIGAWKKIVPPNQRA